MMPSIASERLEPFVQFVPAHLQPHCLAKCLGEGFFRWSLTPPLLRRSIALICRDMGGFNDGYDTFGVWTVGSSGGAPVSASSGLSKASASGQTVTLIFTGAAPQSGYAISVNGSPAEVAGTSTKSSKVLLQLAQPLHSGDIVTVWWPNGNTTLTTP